MSEMTREELKSKWIEALRSNRYTKGDGCFRYTNSAGLTCHCTIGVGYETIMPGYDCLSRVSTAFEELFPEFLLVDDSNLFDRIVELNDGLNGMKPHTFEQMADFLEANL